MTNMNTELIEYIDLYPNDYHLLILSYFCPDGFNNKYTSIISLVILQVNF